LSDFIGQKQAERGDSLSPLPWPAGAVEQRPSGARRRAVRGARAGRRYPATFRCGCCRSSRGSASPNAGGLASILNTCAAMACPVTLARAHHAIPVATGGALSAGGGHADHGAHRFVTKVSRAAAHLAPLCSASTSRCGPPVRREPPPVVPLVVEPTKEIGHYLLCLLVFTAYTTPLLWARVLPIAERNSGPWRSLNSPAAFFRSEDDRESPAETGAGGVSTAVLRMTTA
jgi:hypothetical protein